MVRPRTREKLSDVSCLSKNLCLTPAHPNALTGQLIWARVGRGVLEGVCGLRRLRQPRSISLMPAGMGSARTAKHQHGCVDRRPVTGRNVRPCSPKSTSYGGWSEPRDARWSTQPRSEETIMATMRPEPIAGANGRGGVSFRRAATSLCGHLFPSQTAVITFATEGRGALT
jgi:hypothetical protein